MNEKLTVIKSGIQVKGNTKAFAAIGLPSIKKVKVGLTEVFSFTLYSKVAS